MAKGQTLKIMQQFYKNKPDNKVLLSHGNKKIPLLSILHRLQIVRQEKKTYVNYQIVINVML